MAVDARTAVSVRVGGFLVGCVSVRAEHQVARNRISLGHIHLAGRSPVLRSQAGHFLDSAFGGRGRAGCGDGCLSLASWVGATENVGWKYQRAAAEMRKVGGPALGSHLGGVLEGPQSQKTAQHSTAPAAI